MRFRDIFILNTDGDKSWKEWLTKFAEALGKTETANKLLQDYNQRINNLRQQLGNRLDKTPVTLVNFWNNYTRIYMNDSFAGSIIKEIGLPRPSYQNKVVVFSECTLIKWLV